MRFAAKAILFLGLLVSLCMSLGQTPNAIAGNQNSSESSGVTYQLFAGKAEYERGELRLKGVSAELDCYRTDSGPEGDLVSLDAFLSRWNGSANSGEPVQYGVLSVPVDGQTRYYRFRITGASGDAEAGSMDMTVDFGASQPPAVSEQAYVYLSDSSGPLDHTVSLTLLTYTGADSDKVVFFQKSQYPVSGGVAAWRVFSLSCPDCKFSLSIGPSLNLSVIDANGSSTNLSNVQLGQRYEYQEEFAGGYLSSTGYNQSNTVLEVVNGATASSITVKLFRNGKFLASTGSTPAEFTTGFDIDSTLYVGIAASATEGSLIDPETVDPVSTIDLSSITSATIIINPDHTITIEPGF